MLPAELAVGHLSLLVTLLSLFRLFVTRLICRLASCPGFPRGCLPANRRFLSHRQNVAVACSQELTPNQVSAA